MCDGVGKIKQENKSAVPLGKQVLSAVGETTSAAGSVGLGGMQIRLPFGLTAFKLIF